MKITIFLQLLFSKCWETMLAAFGTDVSTFRCCQYNKEFHCHIPSNQDVMRCASFRTQDAHQIYTYIYKISSFRQEISHLYYRNDLVKYNLNIFWHQSFDLAERKSQKTR